MMRGSIGGERAEQILRADALHTRNGNEKQPVAAKDLICITPRSPRDMSTVVNDKILLPPIKDSSSAVLPTSRRPISTLMVTSPRTGLVLARRRSDVSTTPFHSTGLQISSPRDELTSPQPRAHKGKQLAPSLPIRQASLGSSSMSRTLVPLLPLRKSASASSNEHMSSLSHCGRYSPGSMNHPALQPPLQHFTPTAQAPLPAIGSSTSNLEALNSLQPSPRLDFQLDAQQSMPQQSSQPEHENGEQHTVRMASCRHNRRREEPQSVQTLETPIKIQQSVQDSDKPQIEVKKRSPEPLLHPTSSSLDSNVSLSCGASALAAPPQMPQAMSTGGVMQTSAATKTEIEQMAFQFWHGIEDVFSPQKLDLQWLEVKHAVSV